MLNTKSASILLLAMVLVTMLSLVGCGNSKSSSGEEFGTVTGTYLDAANSTVIATSEAGEFVIPVDAYGRFSANLPVGVYSFSYRAAESGEKLCLTNKTFVVANNVTISVVDATMVPQAQIKAVNVSVVDSDSAIIEWETDIESDGYLEYGTNELYGYKTFVSTDLTILHRVQINSLLRGTTYHFRIVASRHNVESAQTISQDYTFATLD